MKYFAVVLVALLLACGSGRAVRPTAAPAAIESTAVPAATIAAEATPAPAKPAPTPDTPAARYITIAQAGVTIRTVRTAGMPSGEWKADVIDNGSGPEVTLTMPVSIGLDTAQTLRQAKRQIAQAVKAIFDADPTVARVSVIGTLPDGANSTELGAVSIFIERADYARWDGTAENLGRWRIPPRYQ